jgi:hypothetical protein
MMRIIFGPKRDEVIGGWRKMYNEELHNLYSTPNIIRMRWAGHVARMGEKRNAYRILVRKPEGKRPLGRPRRRWVDNIKMDLRELGWSGMDLLIWLRIGTNGDGNEPSGSLKCLGILEYPSDWQLLKKDSAPWS